MAIPGPGQKITQAQRNELFSSALTQVKQRVITAGVLQVQGASQSALNQFAANFPSGSAAMSSANMLTSGMNPLGMALKFSTPQNYLSFLQEKSQITKTLSNQVGQVRNMAVGAAKSQVTGFSNQAKTDGMNALKAKLPV